MTCKITLGAIFLLKKPINIQYRALENSEIQKKKLHVIPLSSDTLNILMYVLLAFFLRIFSLEKLVCVCVSILFCSKIFFSK